MIEGKEYIEAVKLFYSFLELLHWFCMNSYPHFILRFIQGKP